MTDTRKPPRSAAERLSRTRQDHIRELLAAGWTKSRIHHEHGYSYPLIGAAVRRKHKPRCQHCGAYLLVELDEHRRVVTP